MDPRAKIIQEFQLEIDEKKILSRIGYKKNPESISESMKIILAEEKERLKSLVQPRAAYIILDYRETNKHPVFNHAEKVALSICTAGVEIENKVAEFMGTNEILRGMILDAMGSEAVKEIYKRVDRQIAEEAKALGLWPSKRFCPGYKGWQLEQQEFLFSKLPASRIGVSLTESWMMIPRKSLSFRINFYGDKSLTSRMMI